MIIVIARQSNAADQCMVVVDVTADWNTDNDVY